MINEVHNALLNAELPVQKTFDIMMAPAGYKGSIYNGWVCCEYSRALTKNEKTTEKSVFDALILEESRRNAFRNMATDDEIEEALFELLFEDRPEKAQAIQAKRLAIKEAIK